MLHRFPIPPPIHLVSCQIRFVAGTPGQSFRVGGSDAERLRNGNLLRTIGRYGSGYCDDGVVGSGGQPRQVHARGNTSAVGAGHGTEGQRRCVVRGRPGQGAAAYIRDSDGLNGKIRPYDRFGKAETRRVEPDGRDESGCRGCESDRDLLRDSSGRNGCDSIVRSGGQAGDVSGDGKSA